MDKTKKARVNQNSKKTPIKGAQKALNATVIGAAALAHRFTADRGSEFYTKPTEINAAEAKAILKHWNKRNRSLRTTDVRTLCRAIEAGQWILHPCPLVFSENDELLDGQHRLSALVKAAEKALENGEINDLSEFKLSFRVLCGEPNSTQSKIDKNATRSLTDTAVLEKVIGKHDSVGKRALKLCYTSLCKTETGGNLDKGLATHQDAINILNTVFGYTSQTYEEFAREFQEIWERQDRSQPLYLGHISAMFEYARFFPNKAKYLLRLVSGTYQEHKNLDNEGFDTDFTTAQNTIVKRFRDELGKRKESRLKRSQTVEGGSHGGSVFPRHFNEMLYVIQQFHDKTGSTRMSYRQLVRKEDVKGNKSQFNFYWEKLRGEDS